MPGGCFPGRVVGWLRKPFEVGLVKAASTEVKAKMLLGFKTPARSIMSLPMGRASRIHLLEMSFAPAKLQKWQRQKDSRFSWYALKSIPPMESSNIILAQKWGGAKENSLAPIKG
jgi:hypothetical protein